MGRGAAQAGREFLESFGLRLRLRGPGGGLVDPIEPCAHLGVVQHSPTSLEVAQSDEGATVLARLDVLPDRLDVPAAGLFALAAQLGGRFGARAAHLGFEGRTVKCVREPVGLRGGAREEERIRRSPKEGESIERAAPAHFEGVEPVGLRPRALGETGIAGAPGQPAQRSDRLFAPPFLGLFERASDRLDLLRLGTARRAGERRGEGAERQEKCGAPERAAHVVSR